MKPSDLSADGTCRLSGPRSLAERRDPGGCWRRCRLAALALMTVCAALTVVFSQGLAELEVG